MRSLLCTGVLLVGTSAIAQYAKRDAEKFCGAEYVDISPAEQDRLSDAHMNSQRAGICHIHHIRMQKKAVPIYFGLITDDPYYSAEMVYFPNAREHVNGGCVVRSALEKEKHFLFVCQDCKRAQRRWALAHPKSERSKNILAGKGT